MHEFIPYFLKFIVLKHSNISFKTYGINSCIPHKLWTGCTYNTCYMYYIGLPRIYHQGDWYVAGRWDALMIFFGPQGWPSS